MGKFYLLALPFFLFPIGQCPAINTLNDLASSGLWGKQIHACVSSEMQREEPDLWHLSQTVGASWVCLL